VQYLRRFHLSIDTEVRRAAVISLSCIAQSDAFSADPVSVSIQPAWFRRSVYAGTARYCLVDADPLRKNFKHMDSDLGAARYEVRSSCGVVHAYYFNLNIAWIIGLVIEPLLQNQTVSRKQISKLVQHTTLYARKHAAKTSTV